MTTTNLKDILNKAEQEVPLNHEDIMRLLSISSPFEYKQVALQAQKLRQRYFQNKIFLYGFIYFSTHCHNDCTFCLYRKSNTSYPRYRKNADEILETALALANSGVNLLDLTMGEDPYYLHSPQRIDHLVKLIEQIKSETKAAIMISPGVIEDELLGRFKEAGVDWYACYQETHNPELFKQLRVGQSYQLRMQQKMAAKNMGYLIEEGMLVGLEESKEDIADSILLMRKMEADQVRVMTFVPQNNTPLEHWPVNSRFREMLIISIMRLVMPDRLIPASLDVDGLKGLAQRLEAGANVITSIIPPTSGLAGVSQSTLDISEGNRTVEKILPVLKAYQCEPATNLDYQAWMSSRLTKMLGGRKGFYAGSHRGRKIARGRSYISGQESRVGSYPL